MDQTEQTTQTPPSGSAWEQMSGWTKFLLIWLGLSCFGTLLFNGIEVASAYHEIKDPEVQSILAQTTFFTELHRMVAGVAIYCLGYIITSIAAIRGFLKRSPTAVALARIALISIVVINGLTVVESIIGSEIDKEFVSILRSLIFSVAWLVYLAKSQNVKFIIPPETRSSNSIVGYVSIGLILLGCFLTVWGAVNMEQIVNTLSAE